MRYQYNYQDEVSKIVATIEKILRENGDSTGIVFRVEAGYGEATRLSYEVKGKQCQ